MARILIFIYLLVAISNAKEYVVPLFDTNESSGIWQMVGVTGLKDISATSDNNSSNSSDDISVSNPSIPNEDSSSIANSENGDSNSYGESGSSEDEVAISNLFDTNLSNSTFDPLNSDYGSLTMYSYSPVLDDNKWLYYNSRNSDSTNEFTTLQKGLGYWAKYDDNALKFSSNSEIVSNSGFIFDDAFQIGLETFTGKIFEGWNLLSLPEKRTIENIYLITIDYNSTKDYNLSIAKKGSLDIKTIYLDNNSTAEAVKELNLNLESLDIFAVESGIDGFSNSITLFSRNNFYIKDVSGLEYILYPQRDINSTERIYAQSLNGLVIDFNRELLSNLTSLSISINGENFDISNFSSKSLSTSDKSVVGVEFVTEEGNRTLLLSDEDIIIQNNNYIKRYDNPTLFLPDNFFSLDDNQTIFQITSSRDDINPSLISLQNSDDYSIIRGYITMPDLVDNLKLINGDISFSNYMVATNYIRTYQYPDGNNLKYFLSKVFDGYLPSQLITLKVDDDNGIKWESMPISLDMTDWKKFSSKYDPLFSIDKRRAYWVKFALNTSSSSSFSIDKEQSTFERVVFHQVSSDSKTINNIIHYTLQIFLKNVSNSTRGYIIIGDTKIELKPELDGTVFTSQLDYEDIYQIPNLETITKVDVVIVDENGVEDTINFDVNFSQPERPSSSTTFDEAISDTYLKLFQGDLKDFDEVTDINKDLCGNFATQKVYIVRVDNNNTQLPLDKLVLSNPLNKNYISRYKGTSRLDTKSDGYSEQPAKYSDSCELLTEIGEYEGVRIGASDENLSIFYKKSPDFDSTSLDFPNVMYIKVNGKTIKLDFDSVYRGANFYLVDSSGNIYTGKFIQDIYNSETTPYTIQVVE